MTKDDKAAMREQMEAKGALFCCWCGGVLLHQNRQTWKCPDEGCFGTFVPQTRPVIREKEGVHVN